MKTEVVAKTRSRNRLATQDALVVAASAVFAERGYENATTRHIAEVAGCSEGLIQRYFNGKEGLLLATLRDRPHERPNAAFFERPLCASLVDEAREMLAHAAQHMQGCSQAIRIVMSRTLVDPAFCTDFSRLTVRPQIRRLLELRFARYVEAGLIGADVDLAAAVEMLMGMNFQLGFMHPQLLLTSRAELRRLADRQAEMFARAITPPSLSAPATPKIRRAATKGGKNARKTTP